MKKWQIVTGVVVALAAVLSLSMAVFAQGNQPPADAPQGFGREPMGRGMHAANGAEAPMAGHGFRFGAKGETLVDIAANVTGLSTGDVVAELQAGKTFAAIATEHGKSAADLVNAFVTNRKVVLDKAVADGRLTQDVANTMLATMRANVEQHVNGTWQPRGMGYRFNGQQPQFLGPRWNR